MIGAITASVVLLFSTAGLLAFAVKKIPLLLTYPVKEEGNSPKEIARRAVLFLQDSKAAKKVASPELLLQNMLSKTRIAALKTENKTGQILESMRKKSQEKEGNPKFADENYWRKLRRKKM